MNLVNKTKEPLPIKLIPNYDKLYRERMERNRKWLDLCLPIIHIYIPIIFVDSRGRTQHYGWQQFPPPAYIKLAGETYRAQYSFIGDMFPKQIAHVIYAPDGINADVTTWVH